MSRRTFPRRYEAHGVVAREIITRHETETGKSVQLPVPIEMILEITYGLSILHDNIPEEPGTVILGALFPTDRCIVLNARRDALLGEVIGPERFTLAHELAHWVYDAENPNQMTLDIDAREGNTYCYSREATALSGDLRIREVNANNLASHLLMPEHLVRAAEIEAVTADFKGTAAAWGVSQQALRIRLNRLGLLKDPNLNRLDFR